jgi:hypothetical protein
MGPAIVVTGLGAAVAGGFYWLKKTGKLAGLLSSAPAATAPAKPAAPAAPKDPLATAKDGKEAAEQNLGKLNPQYPDYATQVKTEGKATVPAQALYAYLKEKGPVPETAELKARTLAFQKAHNADKAASGIGGQLTPDGLYGPGTSAALTLYTNDPIPGNPAYQPRQATLGEVLTSKKIGENGSNAGVAYQSGYNVNSYLKKNGFTNSPSLQALVRQFQNDVNTDPLYPGVGYLPSPKPPIVWPKLSVDGLLGPQSKAQLLFVAVDDAEFKAIANALKSIALPDSLVTLLRNAGKPVQLL